MSAQTRRRIGIGLTVLVGLVVGGAIAVHAQVGSPLVSHTLFGSYLGVALWAGLWMRFPLLRRLIPLRSSDAD